MKSPVCEEAKVLSRIVELQRRIHYDKSNHPIKFLRNVKELLHYENIYFRQIARPFLAKFLLLRYRLSLLIIAREVWWLIQERLELSWERTIVQMIAVHGTHCANTLRHNNCTREYTRRQNQNKNIASNSARYYWF